MADYFQGFTEDSPHPHMPATGTEGRCELCGENESGRKHLDWIYVKIESLREEITALQWTVQEGDRHIKSIRAEVTALREWKAKVLAQPTAEEWSDGTQLINRPAP
jgi:hypothetical protein